MQIKLLEWRGTEAGIDEFDLWSNTPFGTRYRVRKSIFGDFETVAEYYSGAVVSELSYGGGKYGAIHTCQRHFEQKVREYIYDDE